MNTVPITTKIAPITQLRSAHHFLHAPLGELNRSPVLIPNVSAVGRRAEATLSSKKLVNQDAQSPQVAIINKTPTTPVMVPAIAKRLLFNKNAWNSRRSIRDTAEVTVSAQRYDRSPFRGNPGITLLPTPRYLKPRSIIRAISNEFRPSNINFG